MRQDSESWPAGKTRMPQPSGHTTAPASAAIRAQAYAVVLGPDSSRIQAGNLQAIHAGEGPIPPLALSSRFRAFKNEVARLFAVVEVQVAEGLRHRLVNGQAGPGSDLDLVI